MITETIAAIASGLTHAGIGVIRISGPEACQVADRVVRLKNKTVSGVPTHTVHYGFVCDGEETIDEVITVIMRAPHSFTGEDVVEIQCHGGPLIMKRILEIVLSQGARLAEPGEFSKRAFLNGRLDLSQAEAVMELIQSQNEFARKASLEQLKGSVSEKIRELRGKILYHMAFIEAALDDPEHISTEGYKEELEKMLMPLMDELRELLNSSRQSQMLAEGIRTVILGRPNAGKSSLLNLLLGEERAIVTDIAGTTRDTLEETITLGGISLRLVDTAGIRETRDAIEQIGVERAREQISRADLLIDVVDTSVPFGEEDREIQKLLEGRKAIVLLNKSDLKPVFSLEEARQLFADFPIISFSAREGQGKKELEETVLSLFDVGQIGKNASVAITNVRHREAMEHALASLGMVLQSIHDDLTEDFYSIDLMDAYRELGLILGEEVEEDLVNEIFSKFCVGK